MSVATVADFKAQFTRDFDYGSNSDDVRDDDITRAFAETDAIFNPDIYPTTATRLLAYLYLAAHFLVEDITAAETGGAPAQIVQSRSVGSVSESLSVPDGKNTLAFFHTTYYGQKWYQLTEPYLPGAVYSVPGGTGF